MSSSDRQECRAHGKFAGEGGVALAAKTAAYRRVSYSKKRFVTPPEALSSVPETTCGMSPPPELCCIFSFAAWRIFVCASGDERKPRKREVTLGLVRRVKAP